MQKDPNTYLPKLLGALSPHHRVALLADLAVGLLCDRTPLPLDTPQHHAAYRSLFYVVSEQLDIECDEQSEFGEFSIREYAGHGNFLASHFRDIASTPAEKELRREQDCLRQEEEAAAKVMGRRIAKQKKKDFKGMSEEELAALAAQEVAAPAAQEVTALTAQEVAALNEGFAGEYDETADTFNSESKYGDLCKWRRRIKHVIESDLEAYPTHVRRAYPTLDIANDVRDTWDPAEGEVERCMGLDSLIPKTDQLLHQSPKDANPAHAKLIAQRARKIETEFVSDWTAGGSVMAGDAATAPSTWLAKCMCWQSELCMCWRKASGPI